MATLCIGSAPIYQNACIHNFRLQRPRRFISKSMTKTMPDANPLDLRRRSGNYQPSSWDHSYLLSIENKYVVKYSSLLTFHLVTFLITKVVTTHVNILGKLTCAWFYWINII